jgi:CubicO group peptidase (beta-lactamase class C family)
VSCGARGDSLGSLLAARTRERWMPGAVWRVELAGKLISHGATGFATVEPHPEPLSEVTPFDLASLTKPLCTALLLLLLEQEGLLSLESAAGDQLEELRGGAWASTSLQALACHTSGLPAWRPLYLSATSLDEYVKLIARESREAPAGGTLYSDLGYILLGALLERLTGKSLDRLFEERIAAPLGLERIGFATGTGFFDEAAATERGNEYERALAGAVGKSHEWRSDIIRGRPHDGNAAAIGGVAGHAGLFGTAAAVAGIARAMMADGPLGLEPAARGKLLTVAPGAGRSVGFAGACRSSSARGLLPEGAVGHTGFTGTSLWLDPERGDLFILLTNRVHPVVQPRNFELVRRAFHRLASRR